MTTLIDLVADLDTLDDELTLYAREPWTCESLAIVAREPEAGGLPGSARAIGAAYFLEVEIAKELLEGWRQSEGDPNASARAACRRLIAYSTHDA